MSNELAIKETEIFEYIQNKTPSVDLLKDQFTMFKTAFQLALYENPTTFGCSVASIAGCFVRCAVTGLIPGKQLGEAYIIPYAGKAQFIPGIRGIERLILESGDYTFIVSSAVCENDKFKLPHISSNGMVVDFEMSEDRGNMKGCFATVWTKEGYQLSEYMNLDQIFQAVMKSKSKGGAVPLVKGKTLQDIRNLGGAYRDFPEEQARNRVTARLAKRLKKSNRLSEALTDIYNVKPDVVKPEEKSLEDVI